MSLRHVSPSGAQAKVTVEKGQENKNKWENSGIDTYCTYLLTRTCTDLVNMAAEAARGAVERQRKHQRTKRPVSGQARGPDASSRSWITAPGREFKAIRKMSGAERRAGSDAKVGRVGVRAGWLQRVGAVLLCEAKQEGRTTGWSN